MPERGGGDRDAVTVRRLTPGWRLRATLAALILPPLINLVSLETLSRWIAGRGMPAEPDGRVDDPALAEWVDRVLERLPPPWKRTCLRRAVVLHYLLRKAGRPADLVIGVKRDEQQALAAHAWLSREGMPYLERGAEAAASYQVLTTFSSVPERP
jgi:hypothetical protein